LIVALVSITTFENVPSPDRRELDLTNLSKKQLALKFNLKEGHFVIKEAELAIPTVCYQSLNH